MESPPTRVHSALIWVVVLDAFFAPRRSSDRDVAASERDALLGALAVWLDLVVVVLQHDDAQPTWRMDRRSPLHRELTALLLPRGDLGCRPVVQATRQPADPVFVLYGDLVHHFLRAGGCLVPSSTGELELSL